MFYIRLLDTGKCEQMYWFLHYTIKSNSDLGKNIQKGRTDEADSIFDELISYKNYLCNSIIVERFMRGWNSRHENHW